MVVFGKKWLYSGKVVLFRQNWLKSGKRDFIRAKLFVFVKVIVLGQNGCMRLKVVVLGNVVYTGKFVV